MLKLASYRRHTSRLGAGALLAVALVAMGCGDQKESCAKFAHRKDVPHVLRDALLKEANKQHPGACMVTVP